MAKDMSKLAELPGGALLVELHKSATLKGQTLHELAAELGVSYGYLQHLKAGSKAIPKISDEFTGACARYLGIPRIYVLMMSGKIQPSDFHQEGSESEEQARRRALETIAGSHYAMEVGANFKMLEKSETPCQMLIIRLYEANTGRSLLNGAAVPPSLPASWKLG